MYFLSPITRSFFSNNQPPLPSGILEPLAFAVESRPPSPINTTRSVIKETVRFPPCTPVARHRPSLPNCTHLWRPTRADSHAPSKSISPTPIFSLSRKLISWNPSTQGWSQPPSPFPLSWRHAPVDRRAIDSRLLDTLCFLIPCLELFYPPPPVQAKQEHQPAMLLEVWFGLGEGGAAVG